MKKLNSEKSSKNDCFLGHFSVGLKLDSHLSKMIFLIFCFNESSLKTMENAFYFMLSSFPSWDIYISFLRYLSWLFGCKEKRLEKKAKVIFKNYDATDWAINNYNPYTV